MGGTDGMTRADAAIVREARREGYALRENVVVNVGFHFVPEGDRDDAPTTFPTIAAAWGHAKELYGLG